MPTWQADLPCFRKTGGGYCEKIRLPPPLGHSTTPWCGVVNDDFIFRSLGFESVESIDTDDYEQATHLLDLNKDIPEQYYERFDFVFDGGTLEHVFNFPKCLTNIYKMLKPGGIVVHGVPCNNHVDHGFYQFSPTVFYDYYSANKWKILRSNIFEYSPDHASKPWLIYNYEPGVIDHLSFGGWGDKMLGIWFVAQKLSESSCDVIPMQGAYVRDWVLLKENSLKPEIQNGMLAQIKLTIKSNKFAYLFLHRIIKLCRFPFINHLSKPKVIAKY